MKINDRIQQVVTELFNGKQARFAASIGIPVTTVSNVLSKRQSVPSADFLEKIANSIESIDLRWLLTGSGDMLARGQNDSYSFLQSDQGADAPVPILGDPPANYSVSDLAALKKAIIEKDEQIRTLQNDKEQLTNDKNDLRSDKQRLLDEIYDLKAQLGRTSSQVGKAG